MLHLVHIQTMCNQHKQTMADGIPHQKRIAVVVAEKAAETNLCPEIKMITTLVVLAEGQTHGRHGLRDVAAKAEAGAEVVAGGDMTMTETTLLTNTEKPAHYAVKAAAVAAATAAAAAAAGARAGAGAGARIAAAEATEMAIDIQTALMSTLHRLRQLNTQRQLRRNPGKRHGAGRINKPRLTWHNKLLDISSTQLFYPRCRTKKNGYGIKSCSRV